MPGNYPDDVTQAMLDRHLDGEPSQCEVCDAWCGFTEDGVCDFCFESHRRCDGCNAVHERDELTQDGDLWFCAPCHAEEHS
jgi:hypothetical protein